MVTTYNNRISTTSERYFSDGLGGGSRCTVKLGSRQKLSEAFNKKRKFVDSISNHRRKAEEGLEYIDAIFNNEKAYKDQNL